MIDIDDRGAVTVDVKSLTDQAVFLMRRLGLHRDCELSVVLVEIEVMAALNAQWLAGVGPTDVIAIPMDEIRAPIAGQPALAGVLGDVILCPAYAADQAEASGHPLDEELAVLLTHGVLHLLGHDHQTSAEHEQMFGLQNDLVGEWAHARKSAPA